MTNNIFSSRRLSNKSRSHPLVFLTAVVVAGIMIYPFITPLILSVITAYVINPVVRRLEAYTHSSNTALGILVIIIGLPIIAAVSYIYTNIALIFQNITGFGDKLKEIISALSAAVVEMGFGEYASYFLGAQDMTSRIIAIIIGIASDFVQSVPFLMLEVVVYLYATYHFMSGGHKIIDFIRTYASTLNDEDEHFFSSIMTGLNRGFDVLFLTYFTTSIIVTAASFIVYYVFGAPYALLLAVLTGLFAFLPIFGVWMVYIPAAAYMYYTEDMFAAAGIMVFGFAILTIFIPFILQPYMGAKKSGVSALTILLGFFSGPIIFGAKGVLVGPILFVILETVIVEYMRYRISGQENSFTDEIY